MSVDQAGVLRLSEAQLLVDVLAAFGREIRARDEGRSMSHQVGKVTITLTTEQARDFVAIVTRLADA